MIKLLTKRQVKTLMILNANHEVRIIHDHNLQADKINPISPGTSRFYSDMKRIHLAIMPSKAPSSHNLSKI